MTAPALVGVQLAPAEQLRAVLAQLLQALRRWTVWRARSKTVADGTTKIDKVPTARTNDPTTWLTLDQALAEADTEHVLTVPTMDPTATYDFILSELDGRGLVSKE